MSFLACYVVCAMKVAQLRYAHDCDNLFPWACVVKHEQRWMFIGLRGCHVDAVQ